MSKKIINKINVSPLPEPAVLVTVKAEDQRPNIITIAWTGVFSHSPATVYIAVHPARYSHSLLKESLEYVINIPSENLAKITDYCGIVSGRNVDKFQETGLTPIAASVVKAPLIKECFVNIECKVKDILNFGSHDIFVAEIVATHYDEEVLKENGVPDVERIRPYGYTFGEYRSLGERLGSAGYSKTAIKEEIDL
ncbi:flavin reductase family protein [Desulfosporosinus sp. PR]|uniref:flavin reductase family protein n=1 Tax=Candidatus Desulfosporosinus nitrosoreducens TaxID=3401928 RepID=UPI0027F330CC|nr:flavin reductase family protein [Desulfosporosinus sp. PR]MDQ7094674.1 flavin reductase family protein [Desulfosporosinus sp. PR]